MAEDYYDILGVSRSATQDEIRTAYRQMARKYHPDLNPNDPAAKEKFQKVQNAFDVLNDPQKREMFDRYGSAYESAGGGGGRTAGPHPWATGGGGAGGGGVEFDVNIDDLFGTGGGGAGGFADLFKNFSQRTRRPPRSAPPSRGSNLEHTLRVSFNTAVLGGEAQITVQRHDGQHETLRVKIPAGIESGKKIRLRGQGEPSPTGGQPGDILIKVDVAPHPYFRRTGNRLDVRVPITLHEAIVGAKVDVPTPYGTIALTVPPKTSSGSKLRIKGHGVRTANGTSGDLFAEIQIILPKDLASEDQDQLAAILSKYHDQPRADLTW